MNPLTDVRCIGADIGMGDKPGDGRTVFFRDRPSMLTVPLSGSIENRLRELGVQIDSVTGPVAGFLAAAKDPRMVVVAAEKPGGQLKGVARWLPTFWWTVVEKIERLAAAELGFEPWDHELTRAATPELLDELVERGGLLMLDPSPGALKKFVTGKGNANKGRVLVRIVKSWLSSVNSRKVLPPEVDAHIGDDDFERVGDELEAFALWKMARVAAEIVCCEMGTEHSYRYTAVHDVLKSTARVLLPK